MTAADLLADETFRLLCAAWERDGRCPLSLPDRLRELGLDAAAAGAEWAAWEPELGEAGNFLSERHGGPYPFPTVGVWAWGTQRHLPRRHRCDIPEDVFRSCRPADPGKPWSFVGGKTFPEAVAAFLLAWAAARPLEVPA